MSEWDKWYTQLNEQITALTSPEKEALTEFTKKIGDMKKESPAAWNGFLQQLDNLKDNILQASGISSGVSQIQSAMTMPQRVLGNRLMLELEKMIGPMTSDLRNFLTNFAMRTEQMLYENWIGATAGGIIGGILGYFLGQPMLGAMAGSYLGGAIENAATNMSTQDYFTLLQPYSGGGAGYPVPPLNLDLNAAPQGMPGIPVETGAQNLLRTGTDLSVAQRLALMGTPASQAQIAKYRLNNLII